MNSKSLIWIGMTIGSVAGAYLPLLWGASALSASSIILSAVGGIAGIWGGYKLGKILD
jgi:phage tail tape-measure protein